MWNSKPKKRTCNCRSKAKNNPKYSGGVCYLSGELRPAVTERIKGKIIAKAYFEAFNSRINLDDLNL